MTGRTSDTGATSPAGSPALRREPYPHALLDALLDDDTATRILDWLERQGSWTLERTGLYEQYRCTNILDLLFTPSAGLGTTLLRVADRMEEVFGRPVERRRIEAAAHKLVAGQYIQTHTDVPHDLTETHRAVVSLAPAAAPVTGGELLLQHSRSAVDDAVRVPAVHNSAVLMELSDRSFHSVLPVRSGIRYSLVLSYWAADEREQPHRRRHAQAVPAPVLDFLERIGAHEVPHAGRRAAAGGHRVRRRPLADHLLGTHAILRSWGCDPDVCTAGLFHGVYGPLGLGTALLSPDARAPLQEAIGPRAERLVHLYTALDRRTDRPAPGGGFLAGVLGEAQAAALDGSTVAGVFLISWASLREQVPGIEVSGAETEEILGRLELFGSLIPPPAVADITATLCS
ncbi:2OG-Fe(II) oxygenase [Streptomyces yangpuensis]|uniref:2OG-Fe(II) oxygenase n=1 Tax=Streptomyces yangpuensis TaxID=1648182 RepID=UPI003625220E